MLFLYCNPFYVHILNKLRFQHILDTKLSAYMTVLTKTITQQIRPKKEELNSVALLISTD